MSTMTQLLQDMLTLPSTEMHLNIKLRIGLDGQTMPLINKQEMLEDLLDISLEPPEEQESLLLETSNQLLHQLLPSLMTSFNLLHQMFNALNHKDLLIVS